MCVRVGTPWHIHAMSAGLVSLTALGVSLIFTYADLSLIHWMPILALTLSLTGLAGGFIAMKHRFARPALIAAFVGYLVLLLGFWLTAAGSFAVIVALLASVATGLSIWYAHEMTELYLLR